MKAARRSLSSACVFLCVTAEGREWKLRSPKQTVSRILTDNEIYLYNPNSRKKFEEAVSEHAFDLSTPLEAGKQRRGLIFFQTQEESVASPRGFASP